MGTVTFDYMAAFKPSDYQPKNSTCRMGLKNLESPYTIPQQIELLEAGACAYPVGHHTREYLRESARRLRVGHGR
jgi:hypothetical protein